MTNSVNRRTQASQKRQRLTAAAARVLHEQGVERTTLADIARAADVPVGNVYYYFKTKDELVQAALAEHTARLDELTGRLERLADPRDRLKALVEAWVGQRDVAARHGCPTGTLAAELDKRADAVAEGGSTAIHAAVIGTLGVATQEGICDVIRFLADKGAKAGRKDAAGRTPLQIVNRAPVPKEKVVELLTQLEQ